MLNPRLSTPQATKDDRAVLWWEEIQSGVCGTNEDGVAARRSECCPCCGSGELLGGKGSPSAPPLLLQWLWAPLPSTRPSRKGRRRRRCGCCATPTWRCVAWWMPVPWRTRSSWRRWQPPRGKQVKPGGAKTLLGGMGSWGASLFPREWGPGVLPCPSSPMGVPSSSPSVRREHEAPLGAAQAAGWCRVLPEPANLRGQLGKATRRRALHHAPEPGGDPGPGGMGMGRCWRCHRVVTKCLVSPQSVITQVTSAHDRERLWASHVPFVVRLQARLRGFLVRQQLAARWRVLREEQPAALRIQVRQAGSVPLLRFPWGLGCLEQ